MSVEIDHGACTGCGTCAEICPADVFEMDAGAPTVVDPEACTSCGVCADQCPTDAIDVEMATSTDVANSTGAFEADERFREWSRTLRETLGLETQPVAITLVEDPDQAPEGVSRPDQPLRHCVSIHEATQGATLFVPPEGHACAAGKAALGIESLPEKVANGTVPHMHGLASTQEAAARIMDEIPKLPAGSTVGTLVAPLASTPLEPDVVVLVARPERAMWATNALLYEDGGPRVSADFAGMQASCGDATARPTIEGEVNLSPGCYGCRSAGKLQDEELYVGIPIERMDEVVDGIEGLEPAMESLRDGESGA